MRGAANAVTRLTRTTAGNSVVIGDLRIDPDGDVTKMRRSRPRVARITPNRPTAFRPGAPASPSTETLAR